MKKKNCRMSHSKEKMKKLRKIKYMSAIKDKNLRKKERINDKNRKVNILV